VDELGKYTTELSEGWEVKTKALDKAWNDVEARIAGALQKVERGEASPLLFYMERKLMDVPILSAYTGFWKWSVRRHMRPAVFKKLSESKLRKYAEVLETSVEELKNPPLHAT
jgi:hypothetical protein